MSDSILSHNSSPVNISRFGKHKKESLKLANIYHKLFEDAFLASDIDRWENKEDRVRHCGTLLMGDIYERGSERKFFLSGANFCRVMLCPMCQWRRALKLYSSMVRIWNYVFDDYKIIEFDSSGHRLLPPLRALLLTLTVLNVPGSELKETVRLMSEGWSRFRRLHSFDTIKGYYRCLEVTYNSKSDTYHPHYHVLLLVTEDYFSLDKSNYLHQSDWLELWQQSMRNSDITQVDIRRLKGTSPSSMLKNLNETCKYTCKPSDFLSGSLDQQCRVVQTIDKALDKVRRASFGGWLKDARSALKIDEEDIEKDDILYSDWKKVVPMVWYHWSNSLGEYIE